MHEQAPTLAKAALVHVQQPAHVVVHVCQQLMLTTVAWR